jgi:N-sulfoglucosamine sulfohydrolase
VNTKTPNILYLHSHDTGRYIQPYGYAVPTPHLQHLAEQGTLFRNAFCAAPTCSPSRASLLTGQCAHSSGMLGLAHRGFALQDYRQHLQHVLRERAGYHTALCGVQHVASDAHAIGYDQVLGQAAMPDSGAIADAAIAFLQDAPPRPFFLSVGFFDTHREFPKPDPADDPRYCQPPGPLPDTPQTRQDFAAFKTSARRLDDAIGRILAELDQTGLADNTLVICTTDHGIAFPMMKCNLTDHGMGVMLIIRGPGGFSGGAVVDALVSQIDLVPTVLDLLSIEPPHWLQGHSLLPLMRGAVDEVHDAVFAEVTFHAAYEPQRAVRTRRWKYIRRFDGRSYRVMPNVDDSLSKDVLLSHGWREEPLAQEMLFDLVYDPLERCNLAGDPAYGGVQQALQQRLENWMRATHDPLLKGSVAAPPGSELNDVDGLSPAEPTIIIP